MNLRFWVQALLLLWLSLTAVCGGECVPPVRPSSFSRSPAAAVALSALCLPEPSTRQAGVATRRPPTDRVPLAWDRLAAASGITRPALCSFGCPSQS